MCVADKPEMPKRKPAASEAEQGVRRSKRVVDSGRSSTDASSSRDDKRAVRKESIDSPSRDSPALEAPPESSTSICTLRVKETKGDLFSAPPNTVLVHACNALGSWGKGIAAKFAKDYPGAYEVYQRRCEAATRDICGTAILIPPQAGDRRSHFVGCLFTSWATGRNKDSEDQILRNTAPAMKMLLRLIEYWNGDSARNRETLIGAVHLCKINSGLFGVDWEATKAELEGIDVDGESGIAEVTVVSRSST